MSPRKLTEDDKQEILEQYRNSEATTSTLAKSFEVSSSTISRFLKNKLSTTEYEDLIQQKRLARTPRGEKQSKTKSSSDTKSAKKRTTKTKTTKADDNSSKGRRRRVNKVATNEDAIPELAVAENLQQDVVEAVAKPVAKPTISRRRRRSTARSLESQSEAVLELSTEASTKVATDEEVVPEEAPEAAPTAKLVLDDIKSKPQSPIIPKNERLILKSDRPEFEEEEDDEEDDDEMDISVFKEMLGEDLDDINDEDDEEDDWDEEDDTPYTAASNLSDLQILPLSQASLPRICYLVIDRSAELIVKPLAEFADLGAIPDAETNQRTLPVFDNHRIAKRFSHRRERVIKIPDGRMLQKTSNHLQDKGITRLLIDGQIYSLSQ